MSIEYCMSFTSGGLLHAESVKVAELYMKLKDWTLVQEQVISQNLLQVRKQKSAERYYREIDARLKLLTEEELRLLCDGSRQEQNIILWLAICRCYKFIHEFSVEVLREKFLKMDQVVSTDEYEIFFNTKTEWHDELDHLTDSTKNKLRQVLFRMLHEAELLTEENEIIPCILTNRIARILLKDSTVFFAAFPVFDADVKRWAE